MTGTSPARRMSFIGSMPSVPGSIEVEQDQIGLLLPHEAEAPPPGPRSQPACSPTSRGRRGRTGAPGDRRPPPGPAPVPGKLEPVTLPLAYSLLYFSAVVTNGRCWFVSFQVLGCIRALILS